VRHVVEENARVDAAVVALERSELDELGRLLDASHRSLRDLYESSTPAVEATVARLRDAGAAGARMIGGGFGGSVMALFPPGAAPPDGAVALAPSAGPRLRRAASSAPSRPRAERSAAVSASHACPRPRSWPCWCCSRLRRSGTRSARPGATPTARRPPRGARRSSRPWPQPSAT